MYNALHAHCITPPRRTPKTPKNHSRPNPPKKKHQSTKKDKGMSYLILRARKPPKILMSASLILYHMSKMFCQKLLRTCYDSVVQIRHNGLYVHLISFPRGIHLGHVFKYIVLPSYIAIKTSKSLLSTLFLLGLLLPLWQIQFHPRYHIDHKELKNTKRELKSGRNLKKT